MKSWKTPRFEDIAMNAEIGAYQEDSGEDPVPPAASRRRPPRRPRASPKPRRRTASDLR